jgi:hypothetical protein
VTLKEILDAVVAVEAEIKTAAPGSPELAAVTTRIADLQGELERTRSTMGPLVPDASTPSNADEKSAINLEHALRSLMTAANAKQ